MPASPLHASSIGSSSMPIVDTHRHPITPKVAKAMAAKGLFDPSKPFPQAGAGDVIFYREFIDLDYAMPAQRAGGVTLSLPTNGGEVDWIGKELLGLDPRDTVTFLRDEYLEMQERFPGEFTMCANAIAIDERCRPAVETVIAENDAKCIAVASSYGDGSEREFLDSPNAEWLWDLAESTGLVVHIHPPMNAVSHEVLGLYRLNEAVGRPYDSTVNLARMIGSGLFDRRPNLQVMVVHVGGDITSIIGRLDFCWKLNYHGVADAPAGKPLRCARAPSEYLRSNVLVDTMGFNTASVRAAAQLFGVDRIVLGTDYGPVPYGVDDHVSQVREVFTAAGEAEQVLWRNSDRIFKLGLSPS